VNKVRKPNEGETIIHNDRLFCVTTRTYDASADSYVVWGYYLDGAKGVKETDRYGIPLAMVEEE
jgi:hypothetical protein